MKNKAVPTTNCGDSMYIDRRYIAPIREWCLSDTYDYSRINLTDPEARAIALCYLYVFRTGAGRWKIGITNNLKRRQFALNNNYTLHGCLSKTGGRYVFYMARTRRYCAWAERAIKDRAMLLGLKSARYNDEFILAPFRVIWEMISETWMIAPAAYPFYAGDRQLDICP